MVDKDSTPEVSKDESDSKPLQDGVAPDPTKAAEPVEVAPDPAPTADNSKAEKKSEPAKETAKHKTSTKPKSTPKNVESDDEDEEAPEETDYELDLPSQALQVRIQRALGRHGRYYGPANGIFDERSLKGVQASLPSYSNDSADGNLDEKDAKSLQRFAKKHGDYAGPINGKLDSNSWTGFALALERSK